MDPARTDSEGIGVAELSDLVGELRMMARRFLSSERCHSFTPTGLAMTALRRAKLAEQDWSMVRWENRAHFFSALATAMRHALIDHARRKRGKGRDAILYFAPDEGFFQDLPAAADERPEKFELVEEALAQLAAAEPALADTIQQFYFLGYTVPEMASLSGVSEKTIDRNLKRGRTLLGKYLDELAKAP